MDLPATTILLCADLKYTFPVFVEERCSEFQARGAALQLRGRSGIAYEVDTTDVDAWVLKQRIVGEANYGTSPWE